MAIDDPIRTKVIYGPGVDETDEIDSFYCPVCRTTFRAFGVTRQTKSFRCPGGHVLVIDQPVISS